MKREEKKQKEIEKSKNGSSGMRKMSGGQPNARSEKVKAIEESQKEEEKFINKSVVDTDD